MRLILYTCRWTPAMQQTWLISMMKLSTMKKTTMTRSSSLWAIPTRGRHPRRRGHTHWLLLLQCKLLLLLHKSCLLLHKPRPLRPMLHPTAMFLLEEMKHLPMLRQLQAKLPVNQMLQAPPFSTRRSQLATQPHPHQSPTPARRVRP